MLSKAVIFDMDGTLFQTDKILEPSLEDTFDHLRALNLWSGETPIEQYRKIMGVPLPVVWETLMPDHNNHIRLKANEIFHRKLIENIYEGKGALYPNVKEVFSYLLSKNYSIFIASNGQTEYLRAIVEFYKLDHWVTETFSIEFISSGNKGDLVQHIMKKYDLKAGAVVGDRLSDFHAAKMNGLLSVGCNFDFARQDELTKADIRINDLSEIKRIGI